MVFLLQAKDEVLDHRLRIRDNRKLLVIDDNPNSRVKMQEDILARI